jgi:hypothetical protein
MPMTVYVDGSGMHDGSGVLTLSAFAMDSELIEPFNRDWNGKLSRYGLAALHMRELNQSVSGSGELVGMLIEVMSRFSREFMYVRTCSVVMTDYKEAKLRRAHIEPAELLCVDVCLGGLSIPETDDGKDDVIEVRFDRNEPFQRYMHDAWRKGRKGPRAQQGWPRQVRDIQTADAKTTPGLQVADLFAWVLNRQERCLDQLHLAFISFMTVRHLAYRCAGAPDFKPRRCTWSSSGRLVCVVW